LPFGFLKYFKGFLMKKIVTFVILATILGSLGGCADKEEGRDQFNEAFKLGSGGKKYEKLMKNSCSNQYTFGCASLASYYTDIERDMSKAVKYLKKMIDIATKESSNNEQRLESLKRWSSEVDEACKDKESKNCVYAVRDAIKWFYYRY
jgi:hypothetical protein